MTPWKSKSLSFLVRTLNTARWQTSYLFMVVFFFQNEAILQCTYQLPWYYLTPKQRKIFLIFMHRLQSHPINLFTIKIYSLNMRSFPQVLKAYYTYANFIHQIRWGYCELKGVLRVTYCTDLWSIARGRSKCSVSILSYSFSENIGYLHIMYFSKSTIEIWYIFSLYIRILITLLLSPEINCINWIFVFSPRWIVICC